MGTQIVLIFISVNLFIMWIQQSIKIYKLPSIWNITKVLGVIHATFIIVVYSLYGYMLYTA